MIHPIVVPVDVETVMVRKDSEIPLSDLVCQHCPVANIQDQDPIDWQKYQEDC